MDDLSWRAVLDDGTIINYEDITTLDDGTEVKASIDTVDRSLLANLLTVDRFGKVVHALSFSPPERTTKLAVWRLSRMSQDQGIPFTYGALAGFNQLFPDGHTELKLDFIDTEGKIYSGEGIGTDLHVPEVFTEAEKKAITDAQAEENRKTEEDNVLLATAQSQQLTPDNGNSI